MIVVTLKQILFFFSCSKLAKKRERLQFLESKGINKFLRKYRVLHRIVITTKFLIYDLYSLKLNESIFEINRLQTVQIVG